MKSIVIAAALLALLPAHVGAGELPPEVRVSHADLDLTTAAGVRTFDRRIMAAAKAVCPDVQGISGVARQFVARRCIALAISNAKPQRDRILADATWRVADRTR